MRLNPTFESRIGGVDAVLAALAAIGVLLFVLVGPKLHPDRAASVHVSRDEAIAQARSFAGSAALLDLGNAEAEAVIRRRGAFLDTLQLRLGRPQTIRRVADGELHAYYWHVTWHRDGVDDREEVATTSLSLAGHPLDLSVSAGVVSADALHGEAFRYAAGDTLPTMESEPAFRFGDRGGGGPGPGAAGGDRRFLNRSDAVRFAEYHLERTVLGERAVAVDTVFASGENGIVTATVRLSPAVSEAGAWQSVDVEVMSTGSLVAIEPVYERSDEGDGEFATEDLIELSSMLLFAILGLVLIVVFFRRINARLVDTRAALRDAAVGGVAAGLAMATEINSTEMPDATMEVIFIFVGVLLMSFAAAAFVFFISGAATSVARDRWDPKLYSLDLARQFVVRNVPVGRALVRGVFGGLALVGAIVLILLIFPRLAIHFSEADAAFSSSSSILAAAQRVGGRFFYALFATYTVILGVGGLLHLRTNSRLLSIGATVAVLAFLGISPFNLRPLGAELLVSGVMGAGVAWLFWRFDALTAMTGLFVLVLTGAALGGLSLPSAPEFVTSLLILATVLFVLGLGLAGALSEKTSDEVPVIVPEYIEELSQRERLKRELELAREVQLSFLPRESPHCPGLDIASVCLPAQEVGGDYYDFFPLDERRLVLVVGDVSGKGMQAAFYMTLMKGILQSLATDSLAPAAILNRANDLFRMNAPRGAFMSMVLGVFDMAAGTWTFARAGHNPVLIHRAADDQPELIQPGGAAIGLAGNSIFSSSLEERTLPLAAGDLLLIYTDGVTEAMNEKRALYDDDRLKEAVAGVRGRSADEVIEAIVEDVHAFCGSAPRHDDMTMVAVRVQSVPTGVRPHEAEAL